MPDSARFDSGQHARFPAVSFASQAEFEAHRDHERARLERQARAELALASAEPLLLQEALCAPCLRPARLASRTAAGRLADSGRRVPDWPAEQLCDCEDRLCGGARALLHAALAVGGLRGWTRLLLFGPPQPVHARLAAIAGSVTTLPDLAPGPALAAPDAAFDLIVATDSLHRAPALPALMGELRRVAAPGACLLASFPFRERAAVTHSRRPRVGGPRLAPAELSAIGWDILAGLRVLGWTEAEMLHVWSRALGYLGGANFLLRAVA